MLAEHFRVERRLEGIPTQFPRGVAFAESFENLGLKDDTPVGREVAYLNTVGQIGAGHIANCWPAFAPRPSQGFLGPARSEELFRDAERVLAVGMFRLFQRDDAIEIAARLGENLPTPGEGRDSGVARPVLGARLARLQGR